MEIKPLIEDRIHHLTAQRNEAMDANVELQAILDAAGRVIAALEAQLKEKQSEPDPQLA